MWNSLSSTILGLSGWPVYLIVGALTFAEAAAFLGVILPGETALLLGGVLAARGHAALPLLLAVAIAAAVCGDSVGYLTGRRFGPRLRRSRLAKRIKAEHWARAERFVQRRGPWAVIAGRWVGVLRALVPTAAGMMRMPYRSFLAANLAGGAAWATAVVLLGYSAATSIGHVQSQLGLASAAALVAGAASLGLGWVVRRRRSRCPV